MKPETPARMSFWGVGPSIQVPVGVYAALTGAATYLWPAWFAIDWPPYPALLAAGAVLLALGLVFQAIAGRELLRAYREDRLLTTGVYALCRNPLYANIIFMLLPAAALVCRSCLMLTAVPLAYVLTRLRIGREQRYLEKRFGREYADYRRRTGLLLPKWPRRDEPKH
ncbi:MAG: isoprenylcysteine carboxylmethyltransferase family protein [Pirellulaceae bacterium]|nr:isoprenylcysteine carboxylmethyltransferase family protein [Pirellulaceae bacterium]